MPKSTNHNTNTFKSYGQRNGYMKYVCARNWNYNDQLFDTAVTFHHEE